MPKYCLFLSDNVAIAKRFIDSSFEIVLYDSPEYRTILNNSNISYTTLTKSIDHSQVDVLYVDLDKFTPNDVDVMSLIRICSSNYSSTTVLIYLPDVQIFLEPSDSITIPNTNLSFRRKLAAKAFKALSNMDIHLAESLTKSSRVLVLGSGGREHAIVAKLCQSPKVDEIIVSPGNGGTSTHKSESRTIRNVFLDLSNIQALVMYAVENNVGLVVVGPEQPLVDGVVDAMTAKGIPCFGPTARAATIEASKAWSKDFMARHSIPTAVYRTFTDPALARQYLMDNQAIQFVIKASGLAAGKGVIIPSSLDESLQAIDDIMIKKVFGGSAGSEVVVEQFLDGEEVSVLAFCDGVKAAPMPPAQDHKRVFDDDAGPNTGGMGAYAPAAVLVQGSALQRRCWELIQHTVTSMAKEGAPYKGVLYTGFMLTLEGPYVLEYNCRFGDPETQVLLPLLRSDLYEVLLQCIDGNLKENSVRWKDSYACTVVCAAPGYPNSYPKDLAIHGVDIANSMENVQVYHSGTTIKNNQLVSTGGRVLSVTGEGSSLQSAVDSTYAGVGKVCFDGIHFRSDIAKRGLNAPVLIGVLGSTRGSSLQSVIDAITSSKLNAKIVVIVSNKPDAGILTRAKTHQIPSLHLDATGKTRVQYDAEVTNAMVDAGAQLILMVGYMRVVSAKFVQRWENRCLNVHPSLLPEFAGGMDLQVHEAVLKAKKRKSGCTVHFVTAEVDSGPILVQEECDVDPEIDTAETLKARVQALEGIAFIKAVEIMRNKLFGAATGATGKSHDVSSALTYKSAGVDIDAGEALVEAIKPFCKATRRPGCDADLGGFGGLFDLSQAGYDGSDTVLVSGTDGVGTKLKIAQSIGRHDTVGIDLVAMCVNDILVCGAEPLFFLDYYATGALNVNEAADVVKGIAEGCLQSGSSLIGGETAEMAGMYAKGEYDLAGFSVGAVRRSNILPKNISCGDVLIGLRSSGVHSNGYSLVRKCVEKSGLKWTDPAPFSLELSLGEALLTPTRIYVKSLLPLIKGGYLKGLAHITGGGLLDNVPRILSADQIANIIIASSGWSLPPVFAWLQSIANLPQSEILRTFNCGVGMVIVVNSHDVDTVLSRLRETEGEYFPPYMLGTIEKRIDVNSPQVQVTGEI